MKIKIGLFILAISSFIGILSLNNNLLSSRSKLSRSLDLIDMAHKYQDKGNYLKAINYYTELIKTNKEDFYAYYNRGWNKAHLGKHVEALKDFEKVIELDPNFTMAYINRGSMNYYLGNYSDSITDYNKAIKLDQKNLSIFYNRALSKIKLGESNKSICKDLERSGSINPFKISELINIYCDKKYV